MQEQQATKLKKWWISVFDMEGFFCAGSKVILQSSGRNLYQVGCSEHACGT